MSRVVTGFAGRAGGLAVVVLACALAIVALPADAGGAEVVERSETVSVGAGEHGEYSVACRRKERVSGVGFLSEYNPAAGIGITSALAPTGRQNVSVRGSEVGQPGGEVSHSAYAYCIRELRQSIRIKTKPTVNHAVAAAVARCPGRKRAIGGGFYAPPFGGGGGELAGIVVASHRSSRNSWRVAYYNADGDDNDEFTAYAVCARLKVAEAAATGTAKPGGRLGSARARCPRRRVAISGGFAALVDVGPSDGNLAIPFSSKRVGARSWRTTSAPNRSGPERFKSFAYCMKGMKA